MALIELIKQAGMDAFSASSPAAVMFGTVTKTNPLEVNVDQRLTLTSAQLILTERLTPYSVTIDGQAVVIRKPLAVGDRVLLLRIQGGQQYVVWDRVA